MLLAVDVTIAIDLSYDAACAHSTVMDSLLLKHDSLVTLKSGAAAMIVASIHATSAQLGLSVAFKSSDIVLVHDAVDMDAGASTCIVFIRHVIAGMHTAIKTIAAPMHITTYVNVSLSESSIIT